MRLCIDILCLFLLYVLSLSFAVPLSFSLSHSHSLSLFLSLSLSLSHSFSLSFSFSNSLSLSHTLFLSLFLLAQFNWTDFTLEMFKAANVTVDANMTVLVSTPSYLKNLTDLYDATSFRYCKIPSKNCNSPTLA